MTRSLTRAGALSSAWTAAAVYALFVLAAPGRASAERLGDLASIGGVRDNQLIGYGLVVGLRGTGDDASVPFAGQSVLSMLRRLGIQVDASQVRLRNVAAVMVTATLPPFARNGGRLDVLAASVGTARSLAGGVLLQTPLRGADRRTYAVAQGPVSVGGYSAEGASGSGVVQNHPTVARLPGGAIIEREVQARLLEGRRLRIVLHEADFATAARVAELVRGVLGEGGTVSAVDASSVVATLPQGTDVVSFVARVQALEVEVSTPARVLIDERTGAIVVTGDVRLRPVALAYGGLTIEIQETQEVSQPGALARGDTTTTRRSEVEARTAPGTLRVLESTTTLADLARGLNSLGVTPRDLIVILQQLRASGALRARVEIQ